MRFFSWATRVVVALAKWWKGLRTGVYHRTVKETEKENLCASETGGEGDPESVRRNLAAGGSAIN